MCIRDRGQFCFGAFLKDCVLLWFVSIWQNYSFWHAHNALRFLLCRSWVEEFCVLKSVFINPFLFPSRINVFFYVRVPMCLFVLVQEGSTSVLTFAISVPSFATSSAISYGMSDWGFSLQYLFIPVLSRCNLFQRHCVGYYFHSSSWCGICKIGATFKC